MPLLLPSKSKSNTSSLTILRHSMSNEIPRLSKKTVKIDFINDLKNVFFAESEEF